MPTVNCNSLEKIDWKNHQLSPFKLKGEAHIWRIPSAAAGSAKNHQQWLSEEDLEKADRFLQEKDQQRFICSRIALKSLLGNYLNMDPSEVRIALGTNKKPFVVHDRPINLEFNMAHGGEWILIAFSGDLVGVDV